MLPEFADVGAPKAAVGLGNFGCVCNEVREVFLDVGFYGGAGAFELAVVKEFISDELVVGWTL